MKRAACDGDVVQGSVLEWLWRCFKEGEWESLRGPVQGRGKYDTGKRSGERGTRALQSDGLCLSREPEHLTFCLCVTQTSPRSPLGSQAGHSHSPSRAL